MCLESCHECQEPCWNRDQPIPAALAVPSVAAGAPCLANCNTVLNATVSHDVQPAGRELQEFPKKQWYQVGD